MTAAALALLALLAGSPAALAAASKVDEFLGDEDVVSAPLPARPAPPKSRALEQLITMALREGTPLPAPHPCAAPLGLSSGWSARVLRFKAPTKAAPLGREFVLYYGIEPESGEARPQALLLGSRRVYPKGRTEYEERGCLRLSVDGRLERASYARGRVLMAEDKPLDLESARAKKLLSEQLRYFLIETVDRKPLK